MIVVRQAHHEWQEEPAHHKRQRVVRQAHHERKMETHREQQGAVSWSFLNPLILSLSKDGRAV